MLGMILLILKIIGWVLLGILCLLLAVLLLALFVPVPYRVQAEFGDRFTYRLRVFGIQIFPRKEKAGRKRRRRKKKKADADDNESAEEEKPDQDASDTGSTEQESRGESGGSDAENMKDRSDEPTAAKLPGDSKEMAAKEARDEPDASKPKDASASRKPPDQSLPEAGNAETPQESSSKKGRFRKAKKKKRGGKKPDKKKAEKKKEKKKKTEKKKQDKQKSDKKGMDLDSLQKKWELLRTELTDEGNKRALGHGFSETLYLLRHYGPRKVKADLAYSLADPANTGYVTIVLSLCPFVYGKGCSIIPDFESEKIYAKGWIDIRGHVRLLHVGHSGVRLLFDRDIRSIIKKILKK